MQLPITHNDCCRVVRNKNRNKNRTSPVSHPKNSNFLENIQRSQKTKMRKADNSCIETKKHTILFKRSRLCLCLSMSGFRLIRQPTEEVMKWKSEERPFFFLGRSLLCQICYLLFDHASSCLLALDCCG